MRVKDEDNAKWRRVLWAIPFIFLTIGVGVVWFVRQRNLTSMEAKLALLERSAERHKALSEAEESQAYSEEQARKARRQRKKAEELRDQYDKAVMSYLEDDVALKDIQDWDTLKEQYEKLK